MLPLELFINQRILQLFHRPLSIILSCRQNTSKFEILEVLMIGRRFLKCYPIRKDFDPHHQRLSVKNFRSVDDKATRPSQWTICLDAVTIFTLWSMWLQNLPVRAGCRSFPLFVYFVVSSNPAFFALRRAGITADTATEWRNSATKMVHRPSQSLVLS